MTPDTDIALLELLPADVDENAIRCGPVSCGPSVLDPCNTLGTACCGGDTGRLCNPDWGTFSP